MSPNVAAAKLLAIAFVLTTIAFGGTACADPRQSIQDSSGYVLLDNDNVLFGVVSQVGNQVKVQRQASSTLKLPAARVKCIARGLEELYQFRTAHRFPTDLQQLQRDVRWSLRNGLTRRAAEDVMKARDLAPSDSTNVHLLRQVAAKLQEQHRQATQQKIAATGNEAKPPAVQTVSYESTASTVVRVNGNDEPRQAMAPSKESSASGLDQLVTNHFSARVQPILMNRCVACHADVPSNQTDLALRPAIEATWAPKQVAEDNLNAVMKFIDRENPLESPLRARAMDGHGGARKSFGAPGSAMVRNLDQWLYTLSSSETPGFDPAPQPIVALPQLSSVSSGDVQDPTAPWIVSERESDEVADAENGPEMRRMPAVSNPFDPEIFNRRFGQE